MEVLEIDILIWKHCVSLQHLKDADSGFPAVLQQTEQVALQLDR